MVNSDVNVTTFDSNIWQKLNNGMIDGEVPALGVVSARSSINLSGLSGKREKNWPVDQPRNGEGFPGEKEKSEREEEALCVLLTK